MLVYFENETKLEACLHIFTYLVNILTHLDGLVDVLDEVLRDALIDIMYLHLGHLLLGFYVSMVGSR